MNEHTLDCYRHGCVTGTHPAPRPGHPPTGGPWTPQQALEIARRSRPAVVASDAARERALQQCRTAVADARARRTTVEIVEEAL